MKTSPIPILALIIATLGGCAQLFQPVVQVVSDVGLAFAQRGAAAELKAGKITQVQYNAIILVITDAQHDIDASVALTPDQIDAIRADAILAIEDVILPPLAGSARAKTTHAQTAVRAMVRVSTGLKK